MNQSLEFHIVPGVRIPSRNSHRRFAAMGILNNKKNHLLGEVIQNDLIHKT